MTVNDKLRTSTIKHAHYLELYKTKEVNEILRLMNKTDKELRKKLLSFSATNTIDRKRIRLMQGYVTEIINDANKVLKQKMNETAMKFGYAESEWTVNTLKNTIPKEVFTSFIQPSPTQILAAIKATSYTNRTMTQLSNEWSAKKKNLFNGAIKQGWIQGKSVEDIVDNLFGTKKLRYTDGLVNGSRRELRTNVRTSINHMSSVSRELTYRANKSVIKGVQWSSTLDSATSLICINLDGKVDYIDGKKELNGQRPPAHFNCRSTTVPVTKSLKEMGLSDKEFPAGTRASMNGQVSAKETYRSWFKKQDARFQKKVLGKSRYKLYKEGKLELSRFVQDDTKVLTLEQLKKIK